MAEPQWIKQEAAFFKQLARGRRVELRVACELLDLGLTVNVGRMMMRGDVAYRFQSLNEKDVIVSGKYILEVKARKFAFTGIEDYPHDTAFIGAARRWEGRKTTPLGVAILSEPTGAIIAVPTSTRSRWVAEKSFDSDRRFEETSLAAPRDCWRPWSDLTSFLLRDAGLSL